MVRICLLNSMKRRKMSGLQIDIYLYQKYLNADLYFIGNHHIYKNKQIVKEDYEFLYNYDYIILLEQTYYSNIIMKHFDKNLTNKIKFIYMPNQEITFRDENISNEERYQYIDFILAKTKLIKNKYASIKNLKVIYTKHTSIDLQKFAIYNILDYTNKIICNNKSIFTIKSHSYIDIKPYKTFIHLCSSGWKNTKLIYKYWKEHPNWPMLTILCTSEHFYDTTIKERPKNVTIIKKWVSEEEKIKLLLKNLFHICFSEAEGFGHYINEARSLGRIVITRDVAPMNELVDSNSGIVGNNFNKCISKCVNLTEQQIQLLTGKIRERFEKDNKYFIKSITKFKKNLEIKI